MEILAIITAIIVVSITDANLYASYPPGLGGFGYIEIFLILYCSIISYNYSSKIERGVMGYIFSMPINRKTLARYSMYMEILIPVLMIIALFFVMYEITFFSLNFSYVAFVATILTANISLLLSTGRVVAAITRNGLASFVFLFGFYYSLNGISFHFRSSPLLWLITSGVSVLDTTRVSMHILELAIFIIIISVAFYEISFLLLTHLNLKSGR